MDKIIINADDFGRGKSVNRAIDVCMKKNYITSTTLMVNTPYADEAVDMAKEGGYLNKVGLHINLTEGMPLTASMKENQFFVDENKKFNANFHRKTKYRMILPSKDIACIKDEVEAQIKKYIELVGDLANMHVDSHHHVHTDYVVLKVLVPLIKKYGIKSVRLSRSIGTDNYSVFRRKYKLFYNHKIKKMSSFHTDAMGTFKDYYENKSTSIKSRSVELECHPDYEDGVLINRNNWNNDMYTYFEFFLKNITNYELIEWK